MVNKLHTFSHVCGTFRRTLKSKSKEIQGDGLPTRLYGSENWILTKSQANRIQAAKMRFLATWKDILFKIAKEYRYTTGAECYE